jgi:predicted nucleic acid-binding Zn ribbon protein
MREQETWLECEERCLSKECRLKRRKLNTALEMKLIAYLLLILFLLGTAVPL